MVQQTLFSCERKYEDEFEEWWAECPKKVGKPRARTLWKRLRDREPDSLKSLIEWVRSYSIRVRQEATEDRFILHPATILSQRRWEDKQELLKESEAKKEWESIMKYLKTKGRYSQDPLPVSEKGRKALVKIGGFYKLCEAKAESIKWWENRFIKEYEEE